MKPVADGDERGVTCRNRPHRSDGETTQSTSVHRCEGRRPADSAAMRDREGKPNDDRDVERSRLEHGHDADGDRPGVRRGLAGATIPADDSCPAARLGRRGRRADAARPRLLGAPAPRPGVDSPHRPARRSRHLHAARPRQEAELVPLRVRPERRRPRRGPHLHLLARRGRRRSDQQLDGPGRDEGDHDRPLPRLDARSDDVRDSVRDGPPQRREPDVRRRDHRLRLRHRLDARDGPHRRLRSAPDGGARRRLRAVPALGRRAARARRGRRAVAVQRRRSTSPSSPRSGRSGATAPATAATRCSARSATRCGSRRQRPATRAGSPSTC